MLKTLIISSVLGLFLVSNVNGFLIDNSFDAIPEEWFPKMDFEHHPASLIGMSPCDSNQFKIAQVKFNNKTGLNESLTYLQGDTMYALIRLYLRMGGVPEFMLVCQARDDFQKNMAGQYFSCLNRYWLMNRAGATWKAIMAYLRLFWHLDFLCNQGFEQLAQQQTWDAIGNITKYNGNAACDQQFNQTLGNPPNYNNLCPAALGLSSCIWNLFNSMVGTPIGYYMCEDTRVGFARDCRNIRCLVNSNDTNNYGTFNY